MLERLDRWLGSKYCLVVLQGLNTGVVLYDLKAMRASPAWAEQLKPEQVWRLMHKYGYHVSLGDQDWFTNVGFQVKSALFSPGLFKFLTHKFWILFN